jgi:hypothetical protein
VLEELEVQCGADGVRLVLREHDVSTVVAGLDSLQDVGRVILITTKRFLDYASLVARSRLRRLLRRVVRLDRMVRALGRLYAPAVEWCRDDCCGLQQSKRKDFGDTHSGECSMPEIYN